MNAKRTRLTAKVLIIIAIVLLATATVYADQPTASSPVLLVLAPDQPLSDVVNTLSAQGITARHIFAPDAIIATALPAVDSIGKAMVFTNPVDMAITGNWSTSARQAAAVWNSLQPERASANNTEFAAHPNDPVDSLQAPAIQTPALFNRAAQAGEYLPDAGESSQFFIGSVAVGLVFPESNGTTDASTEDWTETERLQVVSELTAALNWWADREPAAHLSFVYDNLTAATLPTTVEPITRPYTDQKYWVAETMTAKGFTAANYFDQVRAYNTYLRQTYHTDWAFTIFVVDSSTDADNRFSDSYFAYAYIGGPFMVLTYGNNGYGPQNMDAVAAHEIGHIFRALDQYSSANQACTLTAGYLGVENQNSQLGCATNEPSIMRGQVNPFTNAQIDFYARGQLGWWDTDANGVLDPVDAGLQTANVEWAEAGASNILTVNGQATLIPVTSPKYRAILINTLQTVQYKVDDGPWITVTAADGAFDTYDEPFTFTTEPLSTGDHTITLQTTDNFGKVNQLLLAQISTIDPTANQIETQFSTAQNPMRVTTAEETSTLPGMAQQLTGGVVTSVEYRIDGGDWQPAAGNYGSNSVEFTVTVPTTQLQPGDHQIEARAVDNTGSVDTTPAQITITIQPQITTHSIFLPLVVR